MQNRDVWRARTFHVAQSTAMSCIAACVCMARRRRGEAVDETQILTEWGSIGPFALRLHARDLRVPQYPDAVDPDARSSRELLAGTLALGYWVIVTIVPLPHPGRPHAIVLIGVTEEDAYIYLDPAGAAEDQPLAFMEDDFVRQWTGEMVVVEVPAG